MALLTKAGTFTLNTAVGNQSITGVDFKPKVVLFLPTKMTADGVTEHTNLSLGAAASASQRGFVAVNDEDGQGTTDSARRQDNTNCLALLNNGASTREAEADLVSMDPDGFTISIGTAPATAYRVGYLAIGGQDLVDQAVGSFQANNALGNQSITGLGFQPDVVIFLNTAQNALPDGSANLIYGMGWAISTTKRGWTAVASNNNQATSDTARQQRTDACIGILDSQGAVDGEADLVSFDADGFTVNWSNANDSYILYIALRGGQYDCGSLDSQTAAGTFSQTGVGFTPSAGLFLSFCRGSSAGEETGLQYSFGVASSLADQFVAGGTSEDGQGTSDCDSFSHAGSIYHNYNFNQGVNGAARLESFDADGFTLNQTDGDPTGNEILWFMMGSQPAQELAVIEQPIPRGLMFIEQVKFTEPYSLQLVGGDDQRLETFLAQKGIRSDRDLRDILDTDFHPKDRPITTPYPPEVTPPGGGSPGVLYPCGQVPIGGIIMWSGAIADIDTDCWRLCDGTPPTPDLRKKFITGASADAPTVNEYFVGETGGSDEVDISHTHGAGTLVADNESAHTHGVGTYTTDNESAHTHGIGTYAAGNESAHTHGIGTYAAANESAHTHGIGTYAAANESAHTHGFGTLSSDTVANHTHGSGTYATNSTGGHTHGVGTLATGNESAHTHGDGTYAAANDAHTHDVTGFSSGEASHTHAPGTLATGDPTATEIIQGGTGDTVATAAHHHDTNVGGAQAWSGATASGSSHSHADGTYAAASDTHNHDVTGTSAAGSAHNHTVSGATASDGVHDHDVTGTSGNGGSHSHSITGGATGAGSAHTHTLSGTSGAGSAHTHTLSGTSGTGSAHTHTLSGTSGAGSAHNHGISGSSGAGSAHGHTISGSTATGGDTTHDNRPQFYALAFIMRIA